jgi:hypothetical protein
MSRSSHSSAPTSVASGALHVAAHAEQGGSFRPIAKARPATPTRVQSWHQFAADLKRAGYSDDRTAKATGYSRSSIARMRKGQQRVDADLLLWAMSLPTKSTGDSLPPSSRTAA